ncbi:MAG: glycoside hydrolase family 2 TIM barrel-domain containing protein [Candidatus Omnitrophota bacterium]
MDGIWDIAEGGLDAIPEQFPYRVPVPGLVDKSSPDFFEVGVKSARREAFWHHRSFRIDGEIPATAILKIHKAMFGTKVYLNGEFAGEHLPCFTPAYLDVRKLLKGNGAQNDLIIRVGAYLDSVPKSMPNGWDFEKYKYIPGIYDSVELILSGTPYIVRVQTAPDIESKSVRVQAVVENKGPALDISLTYAIREAQSGQLAASGESPKQRLDANGQGAIDFRIPLENARLWSPEEPFLYELELNSGHDSMKTRFGMRSFRFDPQTGRAILNGKPYFMRGTNVCIYRFFEDAARGDLPWRKEWVKKLHEKFQGMHWNSIRYCIGFPPEFWYDIADETGFLIQDEFPIWSLSEWSQELKSEAIAKEYTEWMQERWNHPCVVVWDAQNESVTEETGKALNAVRHLDLSQRPWDNGWGTPQAPGDSLECHPYFFISDHFQNKPFRMSELAKMTGKPSVRDNQKEHSNAIILNEYGWLWLNRDGSETSLTRKVYQNLLGPDSTAEQRREIYARLLAAKTEFWRGHRACAAVMHFCGLGYSRPGGIERPVAGATSDNFIDIEKLKWEPYFLKYVKDAFAPVGLMIDFWDESVLPGDKKDVSISVINDLYDEWQGIVRLQIKRGDEYIGEQSQVCEVDPLGQKKLTFSIPFPNQEGKYQLIAELVGDDAKAIHSIRDFGVRKP